MYLVVDVEKTDNKIDNILIDYVTKPDRIINDYGNNNFKDKILSFEDLDTVVIDVEMEPDTFLEIHADCNKIYNTDCIEGDTEEPEEPEEPIIDVECIPLPINSIDIIIKYPQPSSEMNYTWTGSIVTLNSSGIDSNYMYYSFDVNSSFPLNTTINVNKEYIRLDCKNNANITTINGNDTLSIENLTSSQVNEWKPIINVVKDVYDSNFTGFSNYSVIDNIHGRLSEVKVNILKVDGNPESMSMHTSAFGTIHNLKSVCNVTANVNGWHTVNIFKSAGGDGIVNLYKCKFIATSEDGVVGINSMLSHAPGDAQMEKCIIEFKSLHNTYTYLTPYSITVPKVNPIMRQPKIDCDVKIWGISNIRYTNTSYDSISKTWSPMSTYIYTDYLGNQTISTNDPYSCYWLSPWDYSADMDTLIQGGTYMVISNERSFTRGAHQNVLAKMGPFEYIDEFEFTFQGITYKKHAERCIYNGVTYYRVYDNYS